MDEPANTSESYDFSHQNELVLPPRLTRLPRILRDNYLGCRNHEPKLKRVTPFPSLSGLQDSLDQLQEGSSQLHSVSNSEHQTQGVSLIQPNSSDLHHTMLQRSGLTLFKSSSSSFKPINETRFAPSSSNGKLS